MLKLETRNPTRIKSTSNSIKCTDKSKKYPILSPDLDSMGHVTVAPETPAAERKVLQPLVLMLAHAAGVDSLPAGEIFLFKAALERFEVTAEEALECFWDAYADPYVAGGRIQFRHLWKHIEKRRFGQSGRLFTYEEMLHEADKKNVTTDAFTQTKKLDSRDRPMWALL